METSSTEQLLERDAGPALVQITPSMLRGTWDYVGPFLERICAESEGELTIARIAANLEHWPMLAILSGDQLQAVMLTYLSERDDGSRTLHCMGASGEDAGSWPQVDDQFDAIAKSLGCSRVRIDKARKGWLKTLPHWKWIGVVLEREI